MYVFSETVSRESLRQMGMTYPKSFSDKYLPIPHHELADTVVKMARAFGWGSIEDVWSLQKNGDVLIGRINLSGKLLSTWDYPPELLPTVSLGILNRYDARAALKIVIGNVVFVCSNGIVTGDAVFVKKHTKLLDIEIFLEEILSQSVSKINSTAKIIEKMKIKPVTPSEAVHILKYMSIDMKFLSWNHVSHILNFWDEPRYDEFKDRNMWSLYNAITSYIKVLPILKQSEILNGLYTELNTAWKQVRLIEKHR